MSVKSNQELIAHQMTEAELQNNIVDLARRLGWMVHAERPARTTTGWRTPIQGDAGFPDLVLSNERRIILAELKSEKGKLTVEQEEWQRVLKSAHATRFVCVWRPSDWLDGTIESLLKEE